MSKEDLTIKEIFETKTELEEKLFEAIKQFERITGCLVHDIVYKSDTEEEEPDRIELVTILSNEFYKDLNNKKWEE